MCEMQGIHTLDSEIHYDECPHISMRVQRERTLKNLKKLLNNSIPSFGAEICRKIQGINIMNVTELTNKDGRRILWSNCPMDERTDLEQLNVGEPLDYIRQRGDTGWFGIPHNLWVTIMKKASVFRKQWYKILIAFHARRGRMRKKALMVLQEWRGG